MYNVPVSDLSQIIDHALEAGYTVGWAADVSEKGFATSQKGVAVVPDANREDMSDADIRKWEKLSESDKDKELYKLNKPGKEKTITQEIRQAAFDSQETTDDHAMHIVGKASDQNGTPYYKIKNSWGPYNSYDGYLLCLQFLISSTKLLPSWCTKMPCRRISGKSWDFKTI